MNNADTPATPTLSIAPGQRVRILGDTDPDQTYTVTEVNSVGKTGKQFRCAMICDRTGQTKTGIAPSRLAPPYANRGPKSYEMGGVTFRNDMTESIRLSDHPSMALSGKLPILVGQELLDLVEEAAEKNTNKAHTAVLLFVAKNCPTYCPPVVPRTFIERLKFAFGKFPAPDYRITLFQNIARIHASLFRLGGE